MDRMAATSRDLSRQAIQMDSKSLKETAAGYAIEAALREAEFGNAKQAQQYIREALSLASTSSIRTLAALAWARIGESQNAETELEALTATNALDTGLNEYWIPVSCAPITIRSGGAALSTSALTASRDLLQKAIPYEFGQPSPGVGDLSPLYPVYLRGEIICDCIRDEKRSRSSRNSPR
jgi:hypothetical protein